jgi:hypothetical protein
MADITPIPPATALSYDQSSQLMADPTFRGRVKVAALVYATYIQAEDPTTPAHTSRLKWATGCILSPDAVAMQLQPGVVMDPAVQAAGSTITDDALKNAVQTLIDKIM